MSASSVVGAESAALQSQIGYAVLGKQRGVQKQQADAALSLLKQAAVNQEQQQQQARSIAASDPGRLDVLA